MWTVREYSLARPRVKLWSECLSIGGSCWEKGLSLNWPLKLEPTKKTPLTSFPSCLLERTWIESTFPCALSPHHKGAKRDTIGMIRVSAKLLHCMGHALAYLMENEMPLVHHAIERWGCNCIINDNKGLNERTQGHPMMKPMSKLM